MTARRFKMIFHITDTNSIKDQSSTNSYYLAIIIHTCRSNSGIIHEVYMYLYMYIKFLYTYHHLVCIMIALFIEPYALPLCLFVITFSVYL